ncbi:SPRY domain-containing protein [Lysinibacillus fusiformis]|uniref:SPRY domain-containing protein n=1 Tax=Lysinibacillus fusiformis TaxID=28031 RepID=UPI002E1C0538|nr:SPRY domain-containing protein [Lysinibacillus fusiformis]
MTSGKWYWEITVDLAGLVFIGVLGKDIGASLAGNTQVSPYQRSYSSDGYTRTGGTTTNKTFGELYAKEDVIGVYLDMDNGTLTYFKNNKLMGTPFTDLLNLGGVYAHFTNAATGRTSTVTANFGATPFIYQECLIKDMGVWSLDGFSMINVVNKALIFHDSKYKKWVPSYNINDFKNMIPALTSNTSYSGGEVIGLSASSNSSVVYNYSVFDKVNTNTSGGDAFFSTSGGWVGFNFKNKAIICK